MRFVFQVIAQLRALFRSNRVDTDLAEEMRFHLECETRANIERGMSADAARRAAHLTFGSVDAAQETSRDERPGATVRMMLSDVRFGARLMKKSPGVAAAGITVVALGIAAATAIFSVAYGVMLRPLPFRAPDRLVSIWLERHGARNYPAAADAVDLRQLRDAFNDVGLLENVNLNLVGECAEISASPNASKARESARTSSPSSASPRRSAARSAGTRTKRVMSASSC